MRIGIVVREDRAVADAAAAEAAGAFGVLVAPSDGTWTVMGAAVATSTRFTRIVVRVPLGSDHPISLAEDLAVLDNLSVGRVVALLDTAELDADAAAEDVAVVRAGLTARPIRHRGARWQVPAGLEGHDAPDSIQVTPPPTQVEVPLWLTGAVATHLEGSGLPRLASDPAEASAALPVQPAMAELTGARSTDRELVRRWAAAGATHLLVRATELDAAFGEVARYLAPEVAMPDFPRIVAEALTPPPWEGPARYVAGPGAGSDDRPR